MSTCRRMKIDPYLFWCTKLKPKCIKYLNINLTTLNLMEEKVGISLQCMSTGEFLNITTVAQILRAIISKWDLLKLRIFCKAKDTINKTRWQPTEWEKILTNPTSERGLISKIYKEFKKLDIKISNNPKKKKEYRSKQMSRPNLWNPTLRYGARFPYRTPRLDKYPRS